MDFCLTHANFGSLHTTAMETYLDRSKKELPETHSIGLKNDPERFLYRQTTKEKINANRIFDLEYRVCGQKKFSWIYMNSTSIDVYNTNKSLI